MKPVSLHYEATNPLLRKILNDIMQSTIFRPFYLVGGTSISLRLGHRRSDDIDLFTNAPYGSLDFSLFENFYCNSYTYCDCSDVTDIVGFGRIYYVGNSKNDCIKVDLYYQDDMTVTCDTVDGIRIASLEDVTAMKVDVISRGGRKKDFWDLHEILSMFSIPEMMDLHKQRYKYSHDRDLILNNFTDFSLADEEIDPVCLKGKVWELIKLDFMELITNIRSSEK